MSTKTTFAATCPLTGCTGTRQSTHPYTHALTVRVTQIKRATAKQLYFERVTQVPEGYTVIERGGRCTKGWAAVVEDIPAAEQVTRVYSIMSFHESEKLARSAAKSMERGGTALVECFPVPVTIA